MVLPAPEVGEFDSDFHQKTSSCVNKVTRALDVEGDGGSVEPDAIRGILVVLPHNPPRSS
jgi:hypothetical protein